MSRYGYCPQCGAPGRSRERRINGNDKCENGHVYPSADRLNKPHVPPKRLIDINGDVITEPQHYHESLKWARHMVDVMEEDNIDRSDMMVIVHCLHEEMRFALTMLRDRDDQCK